MSIRSLEDPTVCRPRMFMFLTLTITLTNQNNPIDPDLGGMPRDENPTRDGREDLGSTISESERSEVGSRRVGPTDSYLQPKPHIGATEDGGNVGPPVGQSNGKYCRIALLTLTIALADPDDSINPNRGEDQKNTMGDSGEDWKSITSDMAKWLLRTVRDSADVFTPLKSVAGGLCSILEDYEVWFTSHVTQNPMLRIVPASTGKQAGDRILSAPGQVAS